MALTRRVANATVGGDGELDVRAIGRVLRARKWWILAPTLLVAVVAAVGVNLLTPKYKSEARILYEGRENIFLRPEADKATLDRPAADQEALTSQVQLVLSRDLALQVIRQLKLNEKPEFDPVLQGVSPLKQVLVMMGVTRDPLRMTPEERVLDAYYERLSAYLVDKSRVIVVEFQSADPELAANATNAIADGYLTLQQRAKQEQTRGAGQWLSGEIESLRRKVAEAEAKAESFRSNSNLFMGTNNTSLSNQQLGELNTQLGTARAHKADAETRARLIREMLRKGEPIDASEIVNSELIRRLSEQRVTLQAQLAEQSSTLLDAHPRIKELKAQIADLDRQIRGEAEKLVRTLENDARIAGARLDALSSNLDSMKRQAASTNADDVQLRAFEREAKAQRDLLESYLAKFREATARDSIGAAPSDARVISPAIVSNTPFFPKKLPIVLVATLATLVLSAGFVITGELMHATMPYQTAPGLVPEAGEALVVSRREPRIAEQPIAEPRIAEPPPAPAVAPPQQPEPLPEVVPAEPEIRTVMADSIDDLAHSLRRSGEAGRRVAVFGASEEAGASDAALALARSLAEDSLVVCVKIANDPAASSATAVEADAPGLADLIRGSASFGEVITRDKQSRVHLVPPGRAGLEPSMILSSLRFITMVDALARTYDHVVLDVGPVSDVTLDRAAKLAPRAVLVVADLEQPTTRQAEERLAAAGYAELAVIAGGLRLAPTAQSEVA